MVGCAREIPLTWLQSFISAPVPLYTFAHIPPHLRTRKIPASASSSTGNIVIALKNEDLAIQHTHAHTHTHTHIHTHTGERERDREREKEKARKFLSEISFSLICLKITGRRISSNGRNISSCLSIIACVCTVTIRSLSTSSFLEKLHLVSIDKLSVLFNSFVFLKTSILHLSLLLGSFSLLILSSLSLLLLSFFFFFWCQFSSNVKCCFFLNCVHDDRILFVLCQFVLRPDDFRGWALTYLTYSYTLSP